LNLLIALKRNQSQGNSVKKWNLFN